MARKRIVLYFPRQADPARGAVASAHVLPLSVLALAGGPLADGFEVVLIDGNLGALESAHARVLEACQDALVFGCTGILGFQVADGSRLAEKVRARHPRLFRVVGGWFAAALPEPYLSEGLYDAVAIGQGEVTFHELVQALHAGADVESVAGLCLWREGRLWRTAARAPVGFKDVAPTPWHLIDFEPYRAAQLAPAQRTACERIAVTPPGWDRSRPFVAISYCSSFGCPLPCAFCCSPQFSDRRWKAIDGDHVAEELAELQARWGFQVVNFFDANWAVSESRVEALAKGLLARDSRIAYYPYVQAQSILAFRPRTLDLLAESGLYIACIGAESGDDRTMAEVQKPTRGDDNLRAALELDRRGIVARLSYILGFPGEDERSMLATIDQCRRVALACPRAAPALWPYHPIPGSAFYAQALERGFQPPRTLDEWGSFTDYRGGESWRGRIPPRVLRRRDLVQHFATLARGAADPGASFWSRRARVRMEQDDFRLAGLEAKAYRAAKRARTALRRGPNRRAALAGSSA